MGCVLSNRCLTIPVNPKPVMMTTHVQEESPRRKHCAAKEVGMSGEEVESFQHEGWVVPACRIPDENVRSLLEPLERLIDENPDVRPVHLVQAHTENRDDGGVKGSPEFFDLAVHPMILDAVEKLIGPDICLLSCHVFCKPCG